MSAVRRLVKGCRHGRLLSLKRSYTPGYVPRHAKPDTDVAPEPLDELGLAA